MHGTNLEYVYFVKSKSSEGEKKKSSEEQVAISEFEWWNLKSKILSSI